MEACAQKANDTLFVEEGGLLGVPGLVYWYFSMDLQGTESERGVCGSRGLM